MKKPFCPDREIAREYTENKQDNEIRFRAFRARYCFTPAGGQQAVQQFWSRCRIPARVLRGTQLKRHGYSRLTGVGSFIRLTTGMGSVVESKPTWLLAHSDGIGVVAPGPAGKSRFTGQNLAIEIRRHDGVYESDTVALWPSYFRPPSKSTTELSFTCSSLRRQTKSASTTRGEHSASPPGGDSRI